MIPIKILFITQEDPFYVRIFFEEFIRHFPSFENVTGVVIAPAMGKKSFKKLLQQMFEFYGGWDFGRMGLKYVYYKAGEILSRFIVLPKYFSIAQICRQCHIPVMKIANINADAFLEEIRRKDIDLIISVAAPQIFREKLIGLPKMGCINIHNSKLPKYRGMLPNFWQMFYGEKTVGTTIHRINSGIDDGEILLQRETPILEGESLDSLICRTKKYGAKLMIEAIEGIANHSIRPLPNPSENATYFTFPTRKDVLEFRRKGYRLI